MAVPGWGDQKGMGVGVVGVAIDSMTPWCSKVAALEDFWESREDLHQEMLYTYVICRLK